MIAIINYEAGNVRSVQNAFDRLNIPTELTDDPERIRQADKVIFPGVGEAAAARRNLVAKGLHELIPQLTQPVLGVCVGLQLMCAHSEEGDTPGLNIFPNQVRRFSPDKKVPHMGWNDFEVVSSPLFHGIARQENVYYVHSYFAETGDYAVATTRYEEEFSAALVKDNFFAVQFHPEKSGPVGAQVLQNFLAL